MYPSLTEQIRRQRQREYGEQGAHDLRAFVKGAWYITDPGTRLVWSYHIDAICEHLTAVLFGQIKRLVVCMPPRHMKSTLFSVDFAAWAWIHYPNLKFLTTSYSDDLAVRDSQRSRQIIESEWYQEHWGDRYAMLADVNRKDFYKNNHSGYRLATSVRGSTTGEGGDIIIGDDMHNISEAYSDAARKKAVSYWKNTIQSRLNDQATGRLILIGQMVHEDDCTNYAISSGEYECLVLPAEYEPTRSYHTSVGRDWRTEEGELLWPEKFSKEILQTLKNILQIEYWTQYQQAASKVGGNVIKASYFRRWELSKSKDAYILHHPTHDEEILIKDCTYVISTDLAISKDQEADFTVFLTWALTPKHQALLLDCIEEHYDGPETEEELDTLARRLRARLWTIIIEDVAYQRDLIQRMEGRGWPVLAFTPRVDKTARAHSFAVYMKQASAFFPEEDLDWKAEYERQLILFPRSKKKDKVDATTIMIALYGEFPMLTILETNPEVETPDIVKALPELRELYLDEYDEIAETIT